MKKGKGPYGAEIRSQKVEFSVTSTEKQLLTAKAKSAGLKVSEWLRESAKEAQIAAIMSPEDIRHFKTLCALSNDLNKLVRLADIVGLSRLADESQQLIDRVSQVIDQVFNHDRKNRPLQ
jgi:hypothetical protein